MVTPMFQFVTFLLSSSTITRAYFFTPCPAFNRNRFKWHHGSIRSTSLSSSSVYIDSDLNEKFKNVTATNRNMNALTEWAFSRGVYFAPGVKVGMHEKYDDWGVILDQHQIAGTTMVKIPSSIVLSSSSIKFRLTKEAINFSINSLLNHRMNEYTPEFFLMISILCEYKKGISSPWYPWLRTLPKEFNNGLYLDDLERSCVKQVAFEFLEHQEKQWKSFYTTTKFLGGQVRGLSLLTDGTDDHLIRWAFSIVFTRSWRTQDEELSIDANIVPLGDMFNHDSRRNNVRVHQNRTADDTSVRIVLQKDAGTDTGLYLSYGITQYPARFLVIFGFCDESCPEVYANITFDDRHDQKEIGDMGFTDSTKMVFRAKDGAIGQTVWNAVLYKVLRMEDLDGAKKFYVAHQTNDLRTMVELHSKWETEVMLQLQNHVREMLKKHAPPLHFDSAEAIYHHPRLELIAKYYTLMNDILEKVKEQVDLAIADAHRKNNR
mmetsp:Transcript_17244/g.26296  ORF Transcript_17244/g.26296 Transcript_17244/m.26296 type:complete len:489 (+) Transcript_17244:183-1649(+)